MPSSRFVAAALACCLAAAQPAAGDAGGDELTVQFLTARFLAAVAAVQERVRIEAERLDGTYLAERTGLLWAGDDNGADVDWYAARDHCQALELGGWSDWRLPTIEELEQLHERRSQATYKVPAGIQLTACCPWSATRSRRELGLELQLPLPQAVLGQPQLQLRPQGAVPAPADPGGGGLAARQGRRGGGGGRRPVRRLSRPRRPPTPS